MPDGLHPGAGQGLPGRQRPAPRRRQPGAHRRGRRADRARSPARRRGVAHTIGVPGYSILTEHQHHQRRRHVRHPRAVRGARTASRSWRADAIADKLRKQFARRSRRPASPSSAPRRSTAWAAPAASSCRSQDRGGAGPATRCKGPCRTWSDAGQRQTRAGRPVQQLQRQPAAALRRHRPRQGQGAGRLARRRVSTRCRSTSARSTSTTSPFRPQLAGQRPGRRRRYRMQIEDIGQLKVRNADGRDGAAGDADQRPRRQPARPSSTATTCTRRPRSTATPRRASAPARPSRIMDTAGRRGAARRRWASSGPS